MMHEWFAVTVVAAVSAELVAAVGDYGLITQGYVGVLMGDF